jgi:ribosomal-protein-alanine N-acetyltransferase
MDALADLSLPGWRLRAIRAEDAPAWLAILEDPALRRLTSWDVETLAQVQQVIAALGTEPRASTARRWAIVDADERFVGTIGFKDWSRQTRSAELMFELDVRCRGQGVMSAVASDVIAFGREAMGLRVIRALSMVDNAGSHRLLEKLGFRKTAVHPAFRACAGELRDFHAWELVVER